jgi:SAM-dependent methyltransferase
VTRARLDDLDRDSADDGPSAYGDVFADVYDEWYPDDGRGASFVAALGPPHGTPRLLELGVGTGTLALPLARAGWSVVGLDASGAMLDRFRTRAAAGGVQVEAHLGDVGDPSTWPEGTFDVILAVTNVVSNLVDPAAPRRMMRGCAERLAPNGRVVVEAVVVSPPERRERRAVASPTTPDVRIHTDADPTTRRIHGRHVRLRRTDDDIEVRAWTVSWISPEELDALAVDAGLRLVSRWTGFDGSPHVAGESPRHVSIYAAGS